LPLELQVNTSPAENGPADGLMLTVVGQPTDKVVCVLQMTVLLSHHIGIEDVGKKPNEYI